MSSTISAALEINAVAGHSCMLLCRRWPASIAYLRKHIRPGADAGSCTHAGGITAPQLPSSCSTICVERVLRCIQARDWVADQHAGVHFW
jgi:hypothetical protein